MSQLDEADQQYLLRLARQAITDAVCDRVPATKDPPSDKLKQRCGAFVTLRKRGRLRGCIGYVEPFKPLCQTVEECAVAAARQDPRFDQVTPEELDELEIEISVLSPLAEISPEQVVVGTHGLLISRGLQRGLLLPQVAVEWNWSREEFLRQTCLKAGLPPDAWKKGAKIHAFTAQVFSELERQQANRRCAS